jgi:hypothetical protein
LTFENFKELFISEAGYDILNLDFEWVRVDSCVFHIGEKLILDKYTTNAEIMLNVPIVC